MSLNKINTFKNPTNLSFIRQSLRYFHRKRPTPQLDQKLREKLSTLKAKGWVKLDFPQNISYQKVKEQYYDKLISQCDFELPCLAQTKIDPVKHKDLIDKKLQFSPQKLSEFGLTFGKSDFQNYEEVIERYKPSTLKTYIPQTIDFFNLWLNEEIMNLCEAYMGLRPYLAEAYLRRNFRAEYKVMNHNWHRDTNNKDHILKAFFFFSNVEAENGPHEFVEGTHTEYSLNGKTYYSDEEVSEQYPNPKFKHTKSIVPEMSIILEDTRGLHRAKVPETGMRDLGYAVFFPLPLWMDFDCKHYDISKELYSKLSPRQQDYIPKMYID